MKRVFILVCFVSFRQVVFAQEMWGISNSNFAGNMGMALNPATMVAAPYSLEMNLIALDLFLQNNYIFVKKRSSLLAKSVRGEAVNDSRITDNYTSTLKKGYAQAYLRGPSIILNQGNFSVGVHTAMRAGLSVSKVPVHLAKFIYEGFDYEPQHGFPYHADPFTATLLHWSETGISGGLIVKDNGADILTGAVCFKLLLPMNALFLEASSLDYIVPDSKLLIVNNLSGTYGHTSFDNNENIAAQLFSIKGNGVGGDVGFIYMRGRNERSYSCGKRSNGFKKYKYRMGASFVDIGYVRCLKGAGVYSYNRSTAQWPGIDTAKFDNLADFDSSLSTRFLGKPDDSKNGKGFSIMMPAAFSLQFDYCFKPRWYINGSLIQRLPIGKRRILRPNQISITPRYETRYFEVALPFSLYDYTQPRFGLAFRYHFLVLGTDKIGAITGLWNLTGIDIYFGIKISGCSLARKRKIAGNCFPF